MTGFGTSPFGTSPFGTGGGTGTIPYTPETGSLYDRAIRGSLAIWYSVDATLGGVLVAGATDLRPTGGTITDTTKPGVRRVLNLNLAAEPGLFDALAPIGTTLSVTAHIRDTNRSVITMPMGVFDVDSQTMSVNDGTISLTAPDKWVRIQRARFVQPQQSQWGIKVTAQIAALIRGALGASEEVVITATSTATVPVMTWEKDRDKAIIDLANDIGAWVYFDRDGVATIADVPTIGADADWLIDSGERGVLTKLDRKRSRENAKNVVVVESSAPEPSFSTVVIWDNDPSSPTYAGTDPIGNPGSAGPFGVVPYFHDTPLPLGDSGAYGAARTILARVTGLASQVSLGQVANPAVDAFHVIDVLPPRERYDMALVLERHVVDTVTHDLIGGEQHIEGRSTRGEEYVE